MLIVPLRVLVVCKNAKTKPYIDPHNAFFIGDRSEIGPAEAGTYSQPISDLVPTVAPASVYSASE